MVLPRLLTLATALLTTSVSFAAQTPAGARTGSLEEVTVSATPLGGLELPLDRVPGNIQRATSEEIEQSHQATLASFMNQRIGSVFINEAQSNPLQPDVQFRGFVASPLLGQPQGIAVYQDGVRINDPFGDVVNWALVPEGAISSVDVLAGSNPVFGLNALGGAISLHMKDGFSAPGTQAEVTGGSFGRAIASVESGGTVDDRFSYYGNARYLTEDGWRDHSPSDALNLFAGAGWRNEANSVSLSLTRIETDLIGNGPAPEQLLEQDRNAVYTYPDRTENSLFLATLSATHNFGDNMQLQGVGYYRSSDIDTLNGDEADYDECETQPGFVCNGEGEPALDAGEPIPFSDDVEGAALNRSQTRQHTWGYSLQFGTTSSLAGHHNRLIIGGSLDRSDIEFGSGSELGHFNDSRGVIGSGYLVDASAVDLDTDVDNVGVYFTDTFAATQKLDLTLSARYNDTRIQLHDQLGVALNGDHEFNHLNGAAGITYRPIEGLQLYASYSESNRAPSPVELTCADETAPCALPNAFLADPPLEQVLATTVEAGARGTWRGTSWHAGVFRTDNANDIIFVSAGALTNQGFFENVGDTRRQGVELNFDGKAFDDRLSWYVNYTHLQAQFMESFEVMSPHNPAEIDGEIPVDKGDSIPGVPGQLLAAGASFALTPGLTLSLDMKYQSDQYLRGDEGNLNAPLDGFTTVSLGAQWQATPALSLFVQIENLFDDDYGTVGLYGAADEVLGPQYDDRRFISPGAPFGAWVGFRWSL
jgi:iron complex outermembrane receptor protein